MAQTYATEEKQRRVEACWKMRRKGMTVEEIARHMEARPATIRTYLNDAYAIYKAGFEQEAAHVTRLDLARTDYIIACFWPKMEQGDPRAAGVIIRTLERRARMLGYDKPTPVEVSTGTSLAEMQDRLKQALPSNFPKDVSFVPAPLASVPVTTESLLPVRLNDPPEEPTPEEEGEAADAERQAELDAEKEAEDLARWDAVV